MKAKPPAAKGQVPEKRHDLVDDGPGHFDRYDAGGSVGEALIVSLGRETPAVCMIWQSHERTRKRSSNSSTAFRGAEARFSWTSAA